MPPVETPAELEGMFDPSEFGRAGVLSDPSQLAADVQVDGIFSYPWASLDPGGYATVSGSERVFKVPDHAIVGVARGWRLTIPGEPVIYQIVDLRPAGEGVTDLVLGDV